MVDGTIVYQTKGKIYLMDNAIVCDVEDAKLPGQAKKKHMTILHRKSNKFINNDIVLFEQFKKQWMETKYSNNNPAIDTISFAISDWGQHSVKVHGDLLDFCIKCREKFAYTTTDAQRLPHIAIHPSQFATHPQNIDKQQIYFTSCNVCIVGNCVSINVNDANLHGTVLNKHMVLLWRKASPFNDKEVAQVTQWVNLWISLKKLKNNDNDNDNDNSNDKVSFTIERWGQHSVKVFGDLYDLCNYVRSNLSALSPDPQRIPHIALEVQIKNKNQNNNDQKHNNYSDQKQSDTLIDETKVYNTKCIVTTVGKSVCIDVNDANLPGPVKKKHMVLFWRKSSRFTSDETVKVSQCVNKWCLQQQQINNNSLVSFTITKWGQCSVKVKGDLEALCLYVRQELSGLCGDQQRIPHIALFERNRRNKGNSGYRNKNKNKSVKNNNDNDNNPDVDTSIIYKTNGLVERCGGAIAVSLNDANLIGNVKNQHMTILYRRHPKFTDNEISTMRDGKNLWMKNYGKNQITFHLEPWGKRSCKIKGDLEALCLHLRQQFSSMSNESQRIPHVAVFK